MRRHNNTLTIALALLSLFIPASAAEKGVIFSLDGDSAATHAATDGTFIAVAWASMEGFKPKKGFLTIFNPDTSHRCSTSIEPKEDHIFLPLKIALHAGKIYVAGQILKEEERVAASIAAFDIDCKPIGEALLISAEDPPDFKSITADDALYALIRTFTGAFIIKLDQSLNLIWSKKVQPEPSTIAAAENQIILAGGHLKGDELIGVTFVAAITPEGKTLNTIFLTVADEKTSGTSPVWASAGGKVLLAVSYLVEVEKERHRLRGVYVELDKDMKSIKAYRVKNGGDTIMPMFIAEAGDRVYLLGGQLELSKFYMVEIRGDAVTFSKRITQWDVLPNFIAAAGNCYVVGGLTQTWPVNLADERLSLEKAEVKAEASEISLSEAESLSYTKTAIKAQPVQLNFASSGMTAFIISRCAEQQTTQTPTKTTTTPPQTTQTSDTPLTLIAPSAIILFGILVGAAVLVKNRRRQPPPPPPPPPWPQRWST